MGFFRKIFGRKNKTASPKNALPKPADEPKQGRGARASKATKKSTSPKVEAPVAPKEEDEDLRRTPSFTATSTTGRDSNFSREQTSYSPTNNHGAVKPAPLSTRSAPGTTSSVKQPKSTRSAQSMPVDLDDTDFDESDHEGPAGLSFHQLQKFNMQNQMQTPQQLYNMNDIRPGKQSLLELGSESSQSEFNLSTDAEDEEYNSMKKKVGPYTTVSDSKKVDVSGMSSSLHYTTDEEGTTVFPNLVDENPTASPGESGPIKIVSVGHNDPEEDMRAWGLSPGTGQSSGSSGKENGISPRFHPHKNNFTTTNDDFANFAAFDADFENAFPGAVTPTDDVANQRSSSKRQNIVDGAAEERRSRPNSGGTRIESLTRSESLTDLLAQAKKVGGNRRSKGSSSVNSAPAITAQYLRQYHGLSRGDTKSHNDTSVSDIISSLEATNAARLQSRSAARSVGSRDSGANASVRSAKDRIRERRRRDRERSQHRSTSHIPGSDESEENDPSENWLFDEVTGALGPRGVAADMESLSGRSKSSAGNKSHKSHRSKGSSRRRHQHKSSSGEEKSVDSRGSKNSRNSRYSHKSTRSYLSQMSEQSRSVANDLLRLEMQLAMVGSQENGEDGHIRSGGSVGANSVGGASRASRTSRNSSATRRSAAITKRSKIAVVAPPGKLGIILANKADSKGTVVSGVRTSSVLAEKISPGDRIIAIDGEDVSRMTVSEITTIMARKSEFERTLTVLTTPKHMTRATDAIVMDPEGSYSSFRR